MIKRSKIILALSSITVLVCGGTVSATYAWYQLASEKSVNINGTSIDKSVNLVVGLASSVELKDASNYALTYDEELSTTDKYVYWCGDHATNTIVSYVLEQNGYSTGDLYPVTSGRFTSSSDEFNLYDSPSHLLTGDRFFKKAKKEFYMHLELVFKVTKVDSIGASSIKPNANIYLSSFDISGDSKNSIRTFFSSKDDSFILNPSSKKDGFNYVGGVLDLNADGQYDNMDYADGTTKEVFYGQRDGEVQYGTPYSSTISYHEKNINCFTNPGRTQGVIPLINVDSYAAKANYKSLDTYLYTGDAATSLPLVQTDDKGIGYLSIDYYMEGWDHSLINQVIGTTLGSVIQFVVDEN